MHILVIVDNEIRVEPDFIANNVKEEVKLNSVPQDGIAIFQCGKPLPDGNWDWVAKLGNCLAPIDESIHIDLEIPVEDDPIGNLITAIAAVKENIDTGD